MGFLIVAISNMPSILLFKPPNPSLGVAGGHRGEGCKISPDLKYDVIYQIWDFIALVAISECHQFCFANPPNQLIGGGVFAGRKGVR